MAKKQTGGIGQGKRGPGRPKGVPNRATTEFRDTVRKLLEENSENVGRWLAEVAEGVHDKPDPGRALDLVAKLAEFAAPKLARTEVTGKDGGPVQIVASREDEAL
jgi:hypothetical protein